MTAVLEKFLIAEIVRLNREIRELEKEIELYQRMLKKLRKEQQTYERSPK